MPVVETFDGITDFEKIEERPNSEGYVVHFPSTDLRFKVKHQEYVRLHRILTGINAKRIWEILSAGQSLDEILDRVPDEFYAWVRITEQNLNKQYQMIEADAKLKFSVVKNMESRKEQAQWLAKNAQYPGLVFNMLDGKDYSAQIWKLIQPKYETPFKVDEA
jgi:RNA ligase